MKKIILLVLIALMMAGCNPPPDYQRIDKWQILELDSCEYIQADGYHGYVHKGNCHFCRERMQKELKYIVEQLKEK